MREWVKGLRCMPVKKTAKNLSKRESQKIRTWIKKCGKSLFEEGRISEFMIAGYSINVYYVANLTDIPGYVLDSEDASELGVYYPGLNLIFVATTMCGQELCDDVINQSLLHETIHLTSFVMNRQDLYVDETYTDTLAQYVYQFMKTRK